MLSELHFNPDGTLRPPQALDHFTFMGVPRALKLDESRLEHDYFDLSRRFHPDFFVGANADQQVLSLAKTAALNNAYRVLRDPIARAEYLVELETGVAFGESGEARQVPMELLAEVMEVRERLMEFQAAEAGERETLAGTLEKNREWALHLQKATDIAIDQIATQWDATGLEPECASVRGALVGQLKDALSERRYFSGLLKEIDKAKAPGLSLSQNPA